MRCQMSLDELVEDGESIGRLEPQGTPRRVKSSLEHRFSFPPQQHKLAPGDAPVDPATGKGAGTIVEMDEAAGTVVLRRGPSHASVPFPTALIPPGPIRTNAQRDALARLGAAMLAGNGRYRALEDILARARPRLGGGFSGPIQTMDLRRAARASRRARPELSLHPGAAGHRQDVDGRADRRGSHPPRPARRRRGHEPQGDP